MVANISGTVSLIHSFLIKEFLNPYEDWALKHSRVKDTLQKFTYKNVYNISDNSNNIILAMFTGCLLCIKYHFINFTYINSYHPHNSLMA